MTDSFSEDEVIATITRLTRHQLVGYIKAEFVRPVQRDGAYLFGRIDIARLELLCDLSDDLELNEGALAVVISLLDQLHAARQERVRLAKAMDDLPDDLRARILAVLT